MQDSQAFNVEPETQIEGRQPARSAGAGIHFCKECNNMLVPTAPENRDDPLKFKCTRCGYEEVATDNRVYINIIKRSEDQMYSQKRNSSADPTLRRGRSYCSRCMAEVECVFYMTTGVSGEDTMKEWAQCTVNPTHPPWVLKEQE